MKIHFPVLKQRIKVWLQFQYFFMPRILGQAPHSDFTEYNILHHDRTKDYVNHLE